MIKVERLNGKEFFINCELIAFVEETPDTVITLTTGQKVVVANKADDIVNRIIEYKAKIMEYKDYLLMKEV
ncbi:MAG TPA: flagellar FlbD family protein [Tissierellia bacterium]|nr:flagellar FlbD family protein [Tissierellia bacterium]